MTVFQQTQANIPIDPWRTESIELPMPSGPFSIQATQLLSADDMTPATKYVRNLPKHLGHCSFRIFTTNQARHELRQAYKGGTL